MSETKTTARADLTTIAQVLMEAERAVVCCHAGPDGDAIGSMLALKLLLEARGIDALCLCDGEIPRNSTFLPGVADIVTADPGRTLPADVVAIADVSRYERLGWCAERLDPTAQVVVLDHHLEDHPEGDLCFVDPSYASVGEIVVDLFDAAGQPLSREAAECAYVASITDTGGFRYSNTNRRTHQIAARLVATGLDVAGISARVFDEISCAKFCLMRALLNEARMLCGGRLAVGVLSFDVMEECQARDQDAEGLVNMLRNIEGVDLALLFREPEPGRVKLSSRSKAGLDCAALLRRFGGGGHAAAAGASFEGDIYEVSALVTAAAQETLGGRR